MSYKQEAHGVGIVMRFLGFRLSPVYWVNQQGPGDRRRDHGAWECAFSVPRAGIYRYRECFLAWVLLFV